MSSPRIKSTPKAARQEKTALSQLVEYPRPLLPKPPALPVARIDVDKIDRVVRVVVMTLDQQEREALLGPIDQRAECFRRLLLGKVKEQTGGYPDTFKIVFSGARSAEARKVWRKFYEALPFSRETAA